MRRVSSISAFTVKEIIDFAGQRAADPIDRFQIGKARLGHSPGRTEMGEQRLFPSRADTRDLLQRACAYGFGAALTVAADRKAMGFIAQTLQIVEHRALLIEPERRLAPAVKALAARFALDALGDTDHRHIVDADFRQS